MCYGRQQQNRLNLICKCSHKLAKPQWSWEGCVKCSSTGSGMREVFPLAQSCTEWFQEGRSLCCLCSKRCFPPANPEPWHWLQHNTTTLGAGGRATKTRSAEENLDPRFKNLQCFLNVHGNSSHGWSGESKSDLFASALSLALESQV